MNPLALVGDTLDAQGSAQFRSEGRPPNFEDGAAMGDTGFVSAGVWFMQSLAKQDADMPRWWSRARDLKLREYLRTGDGLTTGVLAGEITRVKNMPWKLENAAGNNDEITFYKNLLNNANYGKGFDHFLNLAATDLLTQDNGFFAELIPDRPYFERVTDKTQEFPTGGQIALPIDKNKIIGIANLDARQCWRTYSPEYPVIYVNPWIGQFTIYHWSRVIARSQFEQPDELARGVGLCGLSRIFFAARFLREMMTYYHEKVSGSGSVMGFLKGLTKEQFEMGIRSATLAKSQSGNEVYGGVTWLASLNPEIEISAQLFNPKGLPDGFDHKSEWEIGANIIAAGLGIELRDVISLSGGGLGQSKGEAEMQHQNTTRKGREDGLNLIKSSINARVMPDSTYLEFDQKDDQEDERRAKIKQMRVATRAAQVASGELMIEEARIMAAEVEDINPEFLDNVYVARQDTDTTAPPPPTDKTTDTPPAIDENEDNEGNEQETKRFKSLTENHTGVMLAFYLPTPAAVSVYSSIKDIFAAPATPNDLHMTLVYLGDVNALESKKITLLQTIKAFMLNYQPPAIIGHLQGIGRFAGYEDNETNAIYASFDSTALPAFRQNLIDVLERTNLLTEQNHGFTPHVTLAYVPVNAPTPSPSIVPNLEIIFDTLTLAWGDERIEFPLAKLKKKTKDYRMTRPSFIQELTALVSAAKPYGGAKNRVGFTVDMRAIIASYGPMAFIDGMRDAGAEIVSINELQPKELKIMQDAVLKQLAYVPRLVNSVYAYYPAPMGGILSRINLWASKGLDGIYNLGVILGARNKNLRWDLGETEKHCETCLAVANQVHRASTWLEYGLYPRCDDLLCGGYQCDCKLKPTNEHSRGSLVNVPRHGKQITEPLLWLGDW